MLREDYHDLGATRYSGDSYSRVYRCSVRVASLICTASHPDVASC